MMGVTNHHHASVFLLLAIADVPVAMNLAVEPQIKTQPSNINLQSGETAEFQCHVQDLGDRHIVWRRGYDVLATERMVLSPDPRISVAGDSNIFSLSIRQINHQDKGEYVCQISTTSGSSNLISVQHVLDILVPAKVENGPETAYLTLKEGEDALLECKVSGNPAPSVHWTRKDSKSVLHGTPCAGGSCVHITNVQRQDAGMYMCTASNEVGSPHSATIVLTVQYPPQIKATEQQGQNFGQGLLRLECNIAGEPKPSVTWFSNSRKLNTSPAIKIQESGNKHTLLLRDSSPSTFGNYSCVAKNILGESRAFIEVHGRPSTAIFSTKDCKLMGSEYLLVWEVISESRILEYRLLYRNIKKDNSKYEGEDWTNVIIPGSEIQNNNQKMSWRLEKLKRDSEYECIVQSRNQYGWSGPSRMFTFNTAANVVKDAETQGLSWSLEGRSGGSANNQVVYFWTLLYPCFTLLHLLYTFVPR